MINIIKKSSNLFQIIIWIVVVLSFTLSLLFLGLFPLWFLVRQISVIRIGVRTSFCLWFLRVSSKFLWRWSFTSLQLLLFCCISLIFLHLEIFLFIHDVFFLDLLWSPKVDTASVMEIKKNDNTVNGENSKNYSEIGIFTSDYFPKSVTYSHD